MAGAALARENEARAAEAAALTGQAAALVERAAAGAADTGTLAMRTADAAIERFGKDAVRSSNETTTPEAGLAFDFPVSAGAGGSGTVSSDRAFEAVKAILGLETVAHPALPLATVPLSMLQNVFHAQDRLLSDINDIAMNLERTDPTMQRDIVADFGRRAFGPVALASALGGFWFDQAADRVSARIGHEASRMSAPVQPTAPSVRYWYTMDGPSQRSWTKVNQAWSGGRVVDDRAWTLNTVVFVAHGLDDAGVRQRALQHWFSRLSKEQWRALASSLRPRVVPSPWPEDPR
jgi:hypothetical protein